MVFFNCDNKCEMKFSIIFYAWTLSILFEKCHSLPSKDICDKIESKTSFEARKKCLYLLFVSLVSEIDVYEFVFAKAKNLTKWMRPVRNANRPLAVKVMVLLTAIISVVTILTPLDSLNSKVLIVYILGRENWANNISRTNWFGKSINSTNIMKSNQTNSTL